ncbi:MAG TPA: MarR family transcriptional regulator [Actinomycetota bacterium]|nr:MarR family transcriptional regulator [Actinomycetota bacterium]
MERIADRLHSAAIHLLRRLRMEDEALGISAPRLSVLSVLVFAGPRRIGELARIEQVEPPTMTRLVDGLVRDGLAIREAVPDDARAVLVRATAEGRRTLRLGRARRLERLSAALGDLPPDDLAALGGGVDVLERVLHEP